MKAVALETIGKGCTISWQGKLLKETKTKYQHCQHIDLGVMGKALFNNGEKQSMDLNNDVYHELLTLPALAECNTNSEIKEILLIGCSEGSAYQVMKDSGILFNLTHIDLDKECMEFCAENLSYGYTLKDIYEDPTNLKIIYGDGYEFIKKEDYNRYDIIIVDLPDYPTLPGAQSEEYIAKLYSSEFYKECYRILKPYGSFLTQGGSPNSWRMESLALVFKTIYSVFNDAIPIKSAECNWSFIVSRKNKDTETKTNSKVFSNAKYLNIDYYKGITRMDNWFTSILNKINNIITEDDLFPLIK